MSRNPKRPLRLRVAVLAVVLGVVGAACGGGSSDDEGTRDVGERSNVTVAPEGDPVPGGKVIFALEAETDGWDPWNNRWAPAGVQVGLTFYDPIAAFDETGTAQPYLAESLTPNDDYTSWDITVRDGISFTNGTPLTSEAIKSTLDKHAESILTSSAFLPMESVDIVDERTARVNMTEPWAAFPTVLTAQGGVVPAPDVPVEELAREPVGTGPFVFSEWVPDKSLIVEKNDAYWREGLPYLDEVEFRPIVDAVTRYDSLIAGDIDMMYTTTGSNIIDLRRDADEGKLQVVEDQGENEEELVLVNTAREPLSDVRLRQALALATDPAQVIDVVGPGVYHQSTGPFGQESPWYADSGWPATDPAAATQLVDEWKADHDGAAPSITLRTTNETANIQMVAVLAEQWKAVGFEVEQPTVDQQTLIQNAIAGEYDTQLWRQFGSADPDLEFHWWRGGSFLNFTGNDDAELNAALDQGRHSDDPDERAAAYTTVQQRMAETVPYVWLYETIAAIGASTQIRGITNGPLPSGDPSLPMGGTFPGITRMTQVWRAD